MTLLTIWGSALIATFLFVILKDVVGYQLKTRAVKTEILKLKARRIEILDRLIQIETSSWSPTAEYFILEDELEANTATIKALETGQPVPKKELCTEIPF